MAPGSPRPRGKQRDRTASGERGIATEPPVSATKTLSRGRSASEWADRLLQASNALAWDATPAAAVEAILGAMSPWLEGAAVGVCAPDGSGGTLVVRVGATERELEHPTRLFPSWAAESVSALLDDGSTLHVALSDADGDALPEALRDRLAVAAALLRARGAVASKRGADDVRDLEAQMIHAERLAGLGQIAAGIVHDLNTPLTTVVAYSDYLRRKWAGPSAQVDEADRLRLVRIHEASERLLAFSRDLMTYSRPSPHVPAAVDIQDVVDRALAVCEHVVSSTRVVVERDFRSVRPVRGVTGQLIQVFVNLITTACQAQSPAGTGRIALCIREGDRPQTVVVTVSDEGVGLPPESDRLFEPFFTTKPQGTGLGLAIVRKIVETHGGAVRAGPNAPRGTVFVVELPLAAGTTDPSKLT
jgi:signal transduction histidine kinase